MIWVSEMDHIPEDAKNQYYVCRQDRGDGMLESQADPLIREDLLHRE